MLNPLRDFILVKEIKLEEETMLELLDNLGNKVTKTKFNNNGTTRYGYIVAVGPENEDVKKNQIIHFSALSGEIVGFQNEDFILLQRFEAMMTEDSLEYIPPSLSKKAEA